MSRKNNDSKNNGWSNLAAMQNDWNISNSKRTKLKLDIQRNHLSQSSITKPVQVASLASEAGPSCAARGRGGTFKRTNSMPTSSKSSSLNGDEGFVDKVQEEFEAEEAVRLAQAVELQMAQSQLQQKIAFTSNKQPAKKWPYGNNGSSGFENLFKEELAADVVEECMLLASQEIQASQNAGAAGDSSFSQAYSVFSKGIDTHSSVLDTSSTFKKPTFTTMSTNIHQPPRTSNMQPPGTSNMQPPGTSNMQPSGTSTMQPPRDPATIRNVNKYSKPSSGQLHSLVHLRNSSTAPLQRPHPVNPQAEAEVRRLIKEKDDQAQKLKILSDSVRTKEGEVSILRSQLKKAVIERDQQMMRSTRMHEASEDQYNEKLVEMAKEMKELKIKLEFQEAELKAVKSRNQLLSSRNTEGLKIVDPESPGTSIPLCGQSSGFSRTPGPPKTPSRHKHVSSFLNRSTFEEQFSTGQPPAKRPRLSEQDEELDRLALPPEPLASISKPETKSVGEQTNLHVCDRNGPLGPLPFSLGQALSNRLAGIQLTSLEFTNTELWKNEDTCFDKKEPIPTLSLMKTGYKSRKRCDAIKPSLVNCTHSLQKLMTWNDPVDDCHPTRASILKIAEECSGILHYNLLLLQDLGRPSNKELRDREQDILSRGRETLPMKSYDLLDERQWYKEENGVEMRRCLGILSEIALVSSFAASLLTGSVEPNKAVIKRHKFLELPDYAFVRQKLPVEDDDRFYLLKVLCDICSLVLDQKLTIAFNGVLAGILSLLSNCAQHDVLDESSQNYFLHVVRHILIARPSSYVLLLLIDLLTCVGNCETVMRGLCTKCDDDDNVSQLNPGLCTFTRDSCALQLICIQLLAVTESNRWRLVDSVSKWLIKVISQGFAAPSWILSSDSNNQSHVACCVKLTTTLIFLLSDAFRMLQNILEKKGRFPVSLSDANSDEDITLESILIRVMRRSIIILFKLVENHIFQFMARVEGLYELLLQGIDHLREYLNLTPNLVQYLEDLLGAERETASQPVEQITSDNPKLKLYLSGVTEMLELS